ncbi:ATP-binding protein [Catenibacterium mitsuokai]|uniref:ATP-binding protein n=1 Tax=Catenibacterium mitsuokai TaxID=100886 RepID=UPI0021FD4289|nr:ATP-binding protein [Catenibacterium mitsuokai]UWO54344.1 ATP-binding protein [Catenibacterium mitsuokai]
MNLKETIVNLRKLKQEGGYWDFKREWYDNDHRQDMLHDIICMANNIENRDAYIIIGIDEKNDFSIVDVEEDKCETKINQNVQKKTNLKTSLNNLEKIE